MTVFVNLVDIGIALFILILLCAFAPIMLLQWFKQMKCKHERYYETGACDAVCSSCGKNLGFIGSIGKKNA